MYRVLFTCDDRVLDGPYLTQPPPWQRVDDGDFEKVTQQVMGQLMKERQLRNWSADSPNGIQIINEKNEIIKSERLF